MKKLFTLFAAALFGCSAYAQSEWRDLVVNGNMEGEQDPEWSCFWSHEFPDTSIGAEQYQGFATIVEDPANPANHCARVICRSEAEADAAENKVTPDGSSDLASWDCQFFIYATESIPEGMELRMTLKVKADKPGYFETQAHWAPGDYNHWQLFGNIENITTEWQKIQVTAKISADHTQSANGKEMQSVAFNLSTDKEGNVFYFDDVKLEIREPEAPHELEEWFNMLRHGTLSADQVGNGRTNFTGRDGFDGVDRQARIVTDELDGEPALNVTSIGWNAIKETPILDEDGNAVLDEDGNPTYDVSDVYVRENGDTLTNIDNWQTQFFITIPHKFTPDSKYRVKFWARADQDATVETQAHRLPGDYIHWQLLGNIELTTEWQEFEFDDMTVTNDQSGSGTFQTIAFNCNVPKEVVNYYFRVEDFSANSADITDNELVLDSEDVRLPIPFEKNEDGVKASINFDECLKVLEANSFENLVNENMTMQNGEDTFGDVDASAGCFLTQSGWLASEETNLIMEMDEVSNDNPNLNVTLYNYGTPLEGGNMFSKFRFSFNKWFYIFNVTFVSVEEYLGISDTAIMPAKSNVVYDLSGRRVDNPAKGLYIVNGKKIIKK